MLSIYIHVYTHLIQSPTTIRAAHNVQVHVCTYVHTCTHTHTQAMLRQYGPSVPEATLRKLVLAFGELREMADEGLIAYPYSTREVVSVVKHLQVRACV